MSKLLRVLIVLLVLFILGNVVFLLTPLESIKNISFLNKIFIRLSERKIGENFIALPNEKILELLSLPENRGKFICPFNVDEGTKVRIFPLDGGGEALHIYDFKDNRPETRILSKSFTSEVLPNSFSLAPNKSGGQRASFRYDGITVLVINPSNLSTISAESIKTAKFGEMIAKGFKNETDPDLIKKLGEYSARIYSAKPDNPREFQDVSKLRLMYKGYWATRK